MSRIYICIYTSYNHGRFAAIMRRALFCESGVREMRRIARTFFACALIFCPRLHRIISHPHRGLTRHFNASLTFIKVHISDAVASIYPNTVENRIKMSRAEERFYTAEGKDLDEVRESISAADLTDQIVNVSSIGRMNLSTSISCLEVEISKVLGNLRLLFDSNSPTVTPDAAALLEEARLLVLFVGHLLTDEPNGETPLIPESILRACEPANPKCAATATSIFNIVRED